MTDRDRQDARIEGAVLVVVLLLLGIGGAVGLEALAALAHVR